MEELSPSKIEKAKEAIEMLSSLAQPSTSDGRPSAQNETDGSAIRAYRSSFSESGLLKRTAEAIKAMDTMRANVSVQKGKRTKKEMAQLFRKKPKIERKSWIHKFLCLAHVNQERTPTSDSEKEELFRAGLGEKEVYFEDVDISAEEFRDIIYDYFPRLRNGGGYRFLKGKPNNRSMELLSTRVLQSPAILKQRVGQSRTYIRPLQKDLDLTPTHEDTCNEPLEQCLTCNMMYSVSELSEHISECRQREHEALAAIDPTDCPVTPVSSPEPDFPPVLLTYSDQMVTENVDSIIKKLIASVPVDLDDSFSIEVRRSHLLEDAIKESRKSKFAPKKLIKVTFTGESAADLGGPRREFFRILGKKMAEVYFRYGISSDQAFFDLNVSYVQSQDWYTLGIFIAMSIIQGGSGFPFLAESVYEYLCSKKNTNITVCNEDIPEPTLRYVLEKMDATETDDDMQVLFSMDEAAALLSETGYRKPICNITVSDKSSLRSVLVDYHCMLKATPAMDQFTDGLQHLKVADMLKDYPILMRPFFVNCTGVLSADLLKGLLRVQFSVKGSNKRQLEEQIWIYFGDFLDDCDERRVSCKVADVLIFFSGADRIPPLGFEKQPQVDFKHGCDKFCTANTCDLTLHLPTCYNDYGEFCDAMTMSLLCNDGFGSI